MNNRMDILYRRWVPFGELVIGKKYIIELYNPKKVEYAYSKNDPRVYVGILNMIIDGKPQFNIIKVKNGLGISHLEIIPRGTDDTIVVHHFVCAIYEVVPLFHHNMMVKIIREKIDSHFTYPIDEPKEPIYTDISTRTVFTHAVFKNWTEW